MNKPLLASPVRSPVQIRVVAAPTHGATPTHAGGDLVYVVPHPRRRSPSGPVPHPSEEREIAALADVDWRDATWEDAEWR